MRRILLGKWRQFTRTDRALKQPYATGKKNLMGGVVVKFSMVGTLVIKTSVALPPATYDFMDQTSILNLR